MTENEKTDNDINFEEQEIICNSCGMMFEEYFAERVCPDCAHTAKTLYKKLDKFCATHSDTQKDIAQVFFSMKELVLEKNRRYVDSAIAPKQVFSKLDALEGIKLRLDDKLSRIINNSGEIRKNDVADLIGYLALLAVKQGWLDFSDLID